MRSSSGLRFTLSVCNFFDSYDRHGRFYGVTDRSNCTVTVTDGPFKIDPWHHFIDRSDKSDRKKESLIKAVFLSFNSKACVFLSASRIFVDVIECLKEDTLYMISPT